MDDSQAGSQNRERQINLLLISISLAIGLILFASALMFVVQGNYPFKEFVKTAGVVILVGTPIVFAPAILTLRNSLLSLIPPSQLMEVVLSTRVMKRFSVMLLSTPVLFFLYVTFLEDAVRGTRFSGPIAILFTVLLVGFFPFIQILEIRQYEKQQYQENAANFREYSLGKFLLKILPSLLSYLAASLLFFAGLFCAISHRGNLYVIVGLLASVVFFFLGRRFAKQLAAQFVGLNHSISH